MIEIESAGLSEVGKKRRENEDRMLVNDALRLYAVADGMGGHNAGEIASQLTVDTLQGYIKNPRKNSRRARESRGKRLSAHASRLLAGIRLSNQIVLTSSRANKDYRGMGTTVAAVSFTNDTFIAANVGDSIIHLIRNEEITQISVLHTLLAERTAVDEEMAERLGREFSHVLTRAIGTHEEVKIDVFEMQCFPDDILVISSDGLTDKASPADIRAIVLAEPPQKACRRLIDLANERGGDDNITAVVVKVVQIAEPPAGVWRWWRAILDKFSLQTDKR